MSNFLKLLSPTFVWYFTLLAFPSFSLLFVSLPFLGKSVKRKWQSSLVTRCFWSQICLITLPLDCVTLTNLLSSLNLSFCIGKIEMLTFHLLFLCQYTKWVYICILDSFLNMWHMTTFVQNITMCMFLLFLKLKMSQNELTSPRFAYLNIYPISLLTSFSTWARNFLLHPQSHL